MRAMDSAEEENLLVSLRWTMGAVRRRSSDCLFRFEPKSPTALLEVGMDKNFG
jgi:hypothetical protein